MKKETIEIKKWEIRVNPESKPQAELVAMDSFGNEYRFESRVYCEGEWKSSVMDIIQTELDK